MNAEDGYEQLRAAIVNGELQPNERLVEADLTGLLGVSRGAVRAALARLTHEGLVEHQRNRGARVRKVDEHEAAEIVEARMALEGLAAHHAAERATPEAVEELRSILAEMRERLDADDLLGSSELNAALHSRILELSAHQIAQRLVAGLNPQVVRFQFRTILLPGRSERSFVEHRSIVEAIVAGDGDAAEAATRLHLANVAVALRQSATRSPSALGGP